MARPGILFIGEIKLQEYITGTKRSISSTASFATDEGVITETSRFLLLEEYNHFFKTTLFRILYNYKVFKTQKNCLLSFRA